MADVRPFKGLRYDSAAVGGLSRIICPPFDTIAPEMQRTLHQRSPHNVVRLESGERSSSDTPRDNRYTRAAATLRNWMDIGVLVREVEPSFYLVEHTFEHRGREWARLELMACVGLEEYDRRVVLPHEYTRDADKRDRMALMEACHANFSPIMCLYRDEDDRLGSVFGRIMADPPGEKFTDAANQDYRVWKIDDARQTGEIREALSSKSLYIADGHHRYETALAYRDGAGTRPGDGAASFVMMGLIGFDDPGLMVLPYHRVLGGLDPETLGRVRDGLHSAFDVQPYPGGDYLDLDGFLDEIELLGRDGLVLGMIDQAAGVFAQLLTIKAEVVPAAWGDLGRSEAWILEEQVLRPILGDSLREHIDYVHDGAEAEAGVRSGEHQMGFFLKPFPLGLFETIMNAGQRLPPKSTFFYPKLPTGLVINLLDGVL